MPDLLISYSECLELLGITSQEGEDFDGFSIRPSGVTCSLWHRMASP
jgi:hypothetical protein